MEWFTVVFCVTYKPLTVASIKQGMLCVAERTYGTLSRAEVKDVLFSSKGLLVRYVCVMAM